MLNLSKMLLPHPPCHLHDRQDLNVCLKVTKVIFIKLKIYFRIL